MSSTDELQPEAPIPKRRGRPPKAKTQALANYDTNNLDRPAGERWITMSNALTRAGHGLTLAEKRIVSMAVSKLDSRQDVPKDESVPRTKITATEYAHEFGLDMDTAYDQLRATAKILYKRSLTFYEPAYKRNGKPLPPTEVNMRWVGEAKYHKGEGWVELAWWPPLMRHLMGLKKQFTSYQLEQTTALRSIYSWRLLELLTRFESTGRAEYTIEDFCTSMDAPPSLSDFAQIRRRIIDPAVTELTEKDGWKIKWEPIKAGRKVKALRFTFKRTAPTKQSGSV